MALTVFLLARFCYVSFQGNEYINTNGSVKEEGKNITTEEESQEDHHSAYLVSGSHAKHQHRALRTVVVTFTGLSVCSDYVRRQSLRQSWSGGASQPHLFCLPDCLWHGEGTHTSISVAGCLTMRRKRDSFCGICIPSLSSLTPQSGIGHTIAWRVYFCGGLTFTRNCEIRTTRSPPRVA